MRKHIYRSAITGRIVTKTFALAHPDITVKEKMHLTNKEKVESLAKRKVIKEKFLAKQPVPVHKKWSFTY